MKDYQSWSLSTEEISSQFDEKFAKLKEYLESKAIFRLPSKL